MWSHAAHRATELSNPHDLRLTIYFLLCLKIMPSRLGSLERFLGSLVAWLEARESLPL